MNMRLQAIHRTLLSAPYQSEHIFRVQTVHSDFVDQNKEAIWGYGTMLAFGSMNGYRAILYLAANGRVYIRHYASETPHYGWMRIL